MSGFVQKEGNFLPLKDFCFLNVFKPRGITSFDVIYKLRKRFNIKKIGHAGTLDPLAEGVMQVGIGKAAKLLDYLPSDKKYTATVKFGYTTDTLDAEGEIIEGNKPKFTLAELQKALQSMTCEIEQIPPKYSAIKVNGKKLCDIARKDKKKGEETEIQIPKRKVIIYENEILNPDEPLETLYNELKISVFCSKGTYIRTFVKDLAEKLGTCAYLTGLIRTQAGDFKIENSVKIDNADLETDGILPQEALQLPKYNLTALEYQKVLNGSKIECERAQIEQKNNFPDDNMFQLIFVNNLVSLAILEDNKFICKKVFKP